MGEVNKSLTSLLRGISDLDYEYAVKAMGNSLALYEKTLRQTMRLLPAHIEKMEQCLSEEDGLSAFAIRIHGIKGSLRQIGCFTLSEAALKLEKAAKAGEKGYCTNHYCRFKEELTRFCGQVGEALSAADKTAKDETKKTYTPSFNYFYSVLMQARAAAEDFDSVTATEVLSALATCSYNAEIEELLAKTLDELEAFRPLNAVECIDEIMKKSENADI